VKNPLKVFRKSFTPMLSASSMWNPMYIGEAFAGAWQRNIKWKRKDVLAHFAIFSCVSLIASDISKLAVNYTAQTSDGIWVNVKNPFPVINNPNHYQNRIQFFESWLISKLIRGNAYILKGRDRSGKVNNLYVLHPDFVTPMVADNGEVFYQLSKDDLNGVETGMVTVPASEIIHDRFNCLYHPLVGLSPIFACGLAAFAGLRIMENSSVHFGNLSRPSGILTAPGAISQETAKELRENWEANYTGENFGKTAVLGDDLKYTPISVTAAESQLVEQLKLSADIVCATFHVPAYKVIGNAPAYNNIEALEANYYSQCLQVLIEAIELLLDEGLEVKEGTGFEFDLNGLLRMDTKTQVETLAAAVKGGIMPPNDAMKQLNLPPLEGGETVYLQQQYYSLAALAKRDQQENPFSTAPATNPTLNEEQRMVSLAIGLRKELLQ
jgi:HK97 family phage portal protein